MINDTKPIFTKDVIDFKQRFLKSLVAPWVFIWIGLLVFFSFQISFLWIMATLFVVTFILMNYKATEHFITKAELKDNSIEFTYYNSKMERKITDIPINELTVEYYGNGIGISSLVSDHMRIDRKGYTIIKQYKTDGWTLEFLKETTEKLNEIKRIKN
ncbi:hypothetical protein MWU65_12025 [Cellulophaga sp. F20128]|uniref:hypothetical protein n=1 Tax=Cellulophaga sp. F20128 TaxID=2926413 RepID=UPI001FF21F23|nr:hypothetical protein [Cellulophaga sp. F20128]MCK0157914.1 hypothetical protein [Cellulophaga sp. F20128]